jgi:hypothetical protein
VESEKPSTATYISVPRTAAIAEGVSTSYREAGSKTCFTRLRVKPTSCLNLIEVTALPGALLNSRI